METATLLYDGDCAICRSWVDYWRGLTGGAIIFRPYQEAAAEFPAIPVDDCRRAVQLVEADGTRYRGAAATFRVLRHAPGRGAWWWLYAHVPGFATAAEAGYAFFARRRGLLAVATRALWGRNPQAEHYDLVRWVFLRLFGAIYLSAFASLGVQVRGLVGRDGLLPLAAYLQAAHQQWGTGAFGLVPTLFWLDAGDLALVGVCALGVALAAAVILDVRNGWPTRVALPLLYVLYLSCFHAGQEFTAFQWDLLLLESGFLAIFLPFGSRIVVWLFRFLAFRYLFMAGVAKVLSGDPTWRNLTALQYHFWTQPLPAPPAWFAARLPDAVLSAGTAFALVLELGLVFLVFLPRHLRMLAAAATLAFQALIILTGNFNFFNLLTALLCVFLFDDAALQFALPRRLVAWVGERAPRPRRAATAVAAALAVVVVSLGIDRLWEDFEGDGLPLVGLAARALAPYAIVNPYGLFANMTTERPQIVIEGSRDGRTWRAYAFRYQPGPVARAPCWNIPHQPRLDWQLWFAALGGSRENPWFANLMLALLEGRPAVLDLLGDNPFANAPPKYVRAQLYDYRFADPATRAATGAWWERTQVGIYFPEVTLGVMDRPPPR
ncbi:MAG TPA: lipase maturation factor family protein [Burkholderiaceae bacterium]|nr:lipase maturation factor family protein [Burkholderiaceae bacterium]